METKQEDNYIVDWERAEKLLFEFLVTIPEIQQILLRNGSIERVCFTHSIICIYLNNKHYADIAASSQVGKCFNACFTLPSRGISVEYSRTFVDKLIDTLKKNYIVGRHL